MKNHDILIHRDSPLLRGLSNTLIVNTQLGIYHIVKILSKITLATFAIMPVVVKAGLEGAVIFTGQGEIINKNFVRQDSARLGINAAGFSIDINENFTLVQNRATDIALIRVIGQDSSAILGRINAKGQLFIINPNGVLFGKDSHVNVGGLVASSLDISNDNFKRGRYKFINSGRAGAVVNNGELAAEKSGYIALIAPEVRNESEIRAKIGTALLASGDRVTLKIDNGSLVNYSIDKGTLNALVENKQLIQVDGGTVFIGAKAANKVTSAVINNAGIIRARTVENHNGVIKLIGDMQSGTVQVNGTLDASAPDGGNGGFIETSAAHVKVSDNAHVITLASVGKNGSWLIDPVDFTIAVTGGDMTGAAVSSALTGGNLLIYSTSGSSGIRGDVNVNDVVNWSANKLTLNAQHSININANMNGTGTAKLELDYAQFDTAGNINDKYFIANGITVNLPTGNNLITREGYLGAPTTYYVINSLGAENSITATDLQGMQGNLTRNYALGSNINALETNSWSNGFNAVGSDVSAFSGRFEGLGHTISNLSITGTSNYQGLFGYATGSISNVNLDHATIYAPAYDFVGAIAGYSNSSIRNSSITNTMVTGHSYLGGLAGSANQVMNGFADVAVTGTGDNVGGLVGSVGDVNASFAIGSVTGSAYVGGLAGFVQGNVSKSFATGNVSGVTAVGGLAGALNNVDNSYATGNVNGTSYVGGLVGRSFADVSVRDTYATGSVTGTDYVGGLYGKIINPVTSVVERNYSTGPVSASGVAVGGFVGEASFAFAMNSGNFWNTQTINQGSGVGNIISGGVNDATALAGKTTAEMKNPSTYSNWGANIATNGGSASAWRISAGRG